PDGPQHRAPRRRGAPGYEPGGNARAVGVRCRAGGAGRGAPLRGGAAHRELLPAPAGRAGVRSRRRGRRGGLGGARRVRGSGGRSAAAAGQAGLAVVLLSGAGLLIASFYRLQRVELGFAPDGVLVVEFGGMPAGYVEEGRAWEVQRQILERVRAIPGVTAASAVSVAPFSGNHLNVPMTVVGNPEATHAAVQWRSVGPDYFRTLGTAVVRGREFTATDDAR